MIRLSRQGAKKNPQFLVVVANGRSKRDGEVLERLGHYFPKAKETSQKLKVNAERVKFWTLRGAQPTQTVGQLLKSLPK